MFLRNLKIYYYLNGRKILSQSGDTDILTVESNKSYLQKMFSITKEACEIEVVAEVVVNI